MTTVLSSVAGGVDTAALVSNIKGYYVDPRDFGSTGVWDQSGATGIAAVFQAALAASISDNANLWIPPGKYLVDTPIDLGVNDADGPQIIGIGASNYFGGNAFTLGNHGPDVIFYTTSVNTPCFYNSHRLRGLAMVNIQILGTNIFTQYQAPNDFPQNYNLGQAYRTSQYSPHCGLALDSFNVATPSDGGYPGMTSKYAGSNQDGSSGIFLDNVTINGFVVGMSLGISGYTSQSDTGMLRNCYIGMCDTAMAIGQGQSKDIYYTGGQIVNCRQAFDGVNWGQGQGWPVVLFGTNLGYLHRIVNYQDTFGPLVLMPNYCESVRSIGNYGTGSASIRGHVTISMGQFTIDNSSSAPPACMFETYGLASIRDTNFQGAGGAPAIYAWNFGNDIGAPIRFDTCTFAGPGSSVPSFVGLQGQYNGAMQGSVVEMVNCLMNCGSPLQWSDNSTADVSVFTTSNRFQGTVRSGRYSNGTGVVDYASPNTTGAIGIAATSTTLVTRSVTFSTITGGSTASLALTSGNWSDLSGWYMTTFPNADVRPVLYKNGNATASLEQWACSSTMSGPVSCTVANVALTFTATDATLPQVGDILVWYMIKQYSSGTKRGYPAWIITSVVSGAVTAQPLFDATQYDTVANNFSGTTIYICQQNWAPSGSALTCTTDGTTAVITSVSPITVLKNGDWLSGSAGIPANSRVVSGGGTATVTLNKNTTAANSGVTLRLGTLQTPTVTTAW